MKALALVLFSAVTLAQLCVPASMIWKREKTLKEGRAWKFRTAPIDPTDAFRGRYIALGFVADEVPRFEPFQDENRGQAYAVLKEDPDGFAIVETLSVKPVSGDNVIKVRSGYWNNSDKVQNIGLPFDRFWVTEKIAPAAERAANSRSQKQDAYVLVRVRDGDAAVEQLYIGNQPLTAYLRSHPK